MSEKSPTPSWLGRIYALPYQPAETAIGLSELSEVLDAAIVGIFSHDPAAPALRPISGHGISDGDLSSLGNQTWMSELGEELRDSPTHEVVSLTIDMGPRNFSRSHRKGHWAGISVATDESVRLHLLAYRPPDRPPFESEAKRALAEAAAPLQHAADYWADCARHRIAFRAQQLALDESATAVLVVAASGRIIAGGDAAEALVARWSGLELRESGVATALPEEAPMLAQALAQAWEASAKGEACFAGQLRLRAPDRHGLLVEVLSNPGPVEPGTPWHHEAAAVLVLRAPVERRALSARAGQKLTPRQREIAEVLLSGATNEEIAGAMSVSVNTVRSHLKQMFNALEVTNRVELVTALIEP